MNKKIRIFDFDYITRGYSLLFGSSKSPIKGNGLEFKALREYEPGDNVKFIDWLISAREGKPYIKEYEEDKELNIVFLLDVGEFMAFGEGKYTKLDSLKYSFNVLALSAINKGHKVSAFTFDENILSNVPPSKSRSVVSKVNDLLIPTSKDSNLELVLEKFNDFNIKKSLVFILTDNDEIKDIKPYKIASQKNDVIYINIFDYFENNLGDKGMLNFISHKVNSFISLGKQDKISSYRTLRMEKFKNLKNNLLKNRILYLNLDNKRDIYKELLYFLKK